MHLNDISHKYIWLLALMRRQAAERSTVVATATDIAQTIFDRFQETHWMSIISTNTWEKKDPG